MPIYTRSDLWWGGAWVQNQRTAQQLVQYYFHGNFLKRAATITKGKKIGFI